MFNEYLTTIVLKLRTVIEKSNIELTELLHFLKKREDFLKTRGIVTDKIKHILGHHRSEKRKLWGTDLVLNPLGGLATLQRPSSGIFWQSSPRFNSCNSP